MIYKCVGVPHFIVVRHASIADLEMTRVVGGNLVKVLGWYDNEMGYTYTLVDHVVRTNLLYCAMKTYIVFPVFTT